MHGAPGRLVLSARTNLPATPLARYIAPAFRSVAYSTETRTSTVSSSGSTPPFRPPPKRDEKPAAAGEAPLPPVRSASTPVETSPSTAAFKIEKSSTTAAIVNADADRAAQEKAIEKAREKEKALTAKKGSRLQRIWASTKEEAKHYWHGFKLLGREIRISWRLFRKLLRGESLTRREDRQLKRTSKDLLRTIPFSVFIIVPLGEALLPVFIKLFPSMLPSTFAKDFEKEEQQRKLLKVRLETAKFLQTTIRESPISPSERTRNSTAYKEFFRKVRATGESPSTEDIMKVASLFEDNLTLDNLSRPQLISTCRYMNINAFGTDNFLRHTIRSRMDKIRQDDKTIDREGLDALRESELIQACQSRGIRTSEKTPDELRAELGQWIDLHIKQNLSGTLLFLCKAFSFTQEGKNPTENMIASIKDVLSSLPDELVSETELDLTDTSATPQQRLEVLEQQEDLIEDEAEQEAREQEARRQKKEADAAKKEEETRLAKEAKDSKEAEHGAAGDTTGTAKDEPVDAEEAATEEPEAEHDARMTSEQLSELGQALSILSAKSSVLKERADLQDLMQANRQTTAADESDAAANEAEAELEPTPEDAEADKQAAADAKRRADLSKRIGKMIQKIDAQLEAYDKSVGANLNMISVDKDGKIHQSDLRKALEVIAHRPEDDVIAGIIEKLDVDHDGWIPLDDVLGLAQGEGLGILLEEGAGSLLSEGQQLREDPAAPQHQAQPEKSCKPKKSDIVDD